MLKRRISVRMRLRNACVAHPVGDQRAHPRRALRTVVVGAGHADFLGDRLAVMADAGVLDAAAGLRIAEEVARMLDRRLQHHAVRVAAAAADEEAHRVHQRQRAARDRRQLLAFLDFFPVAHVGAADRSSARRAPPGRCGRAPRRCIRAGRCPCTCRCRAPPCARGACRCRARGRPVRRAGCSRRPRRTGARDGPRTCSPFLRRRRRARSRVMRSPGRTWRNSSQSLPA